MFEVFINTKNLKTMKSLISLTGAQIINKHQQLTINGGYRTSLCDTDPEYYMANFDLCNGRDSDDSDDGNS